MPTTLQSTLLLALPLLSLASFHHPQSNTFYKRQAFQPQVTSCGEGATCAESCGAGYLLCSDADTFLCYNPGIGDTCCQPGSAASWACPVSNFCLIDDFCCPDGEDAQSCAVSNSVTLPAGFSASTAPPLAAATSSSDTAPVTTAAPTSTTSAGVVASFTTTAAVSVSTFTGAANPGAGAGAGVGAGMGLVYGVLALVGNWL